MNHTDHATRRFHLDGEWQGAQAGRNAFTNTTNAGIQPSTAVDAMIDVRNRIAHRPSPCHQVVIPTDRVKPRALQPFQNIGRFRASVHKVPYGKQSVLFWRELYGSQRDFKPTKMTMYVTHRKITAVGIQLKAPDSDITGRHSEIPYSSLTT
ncbi:hypothetical protein A9J41_06805 [Laribacter hongkongensis]|nr:hypothetical protein [Laribacter hongkongensis]MBE5529844.1 hypothetical protein [Laribacter hongkongensis]